MVVAGVDYRFYINGDKDNGSAENSGVRLYNYDNTYSKKLGYASFSPYDKFDGKLDNVMVFNRALSDDEIKAIYNATIEDTLSYDDNGNLTNDGTNTYSYDCENQLISVILADDTEIT